VTPEAATAEAVPATAEEAEVEPKKIQLGAAEEEVETETIQTFEELIGEEDEEDEDGKKGGKKGKKKGKGAAQREIVFDEDLGMYIAKKKRKAGRGGADWEGMEE
jgi:hypothetical protein